MPDGGGADVVVTLTHVMSDGRRVHLHTASQPDMSEVSGWPELGVSWCCKYTKEESTDRRLGHSTITQREGSSPLALDGNKSCLVIVLLPLLCCTRDTSSRCSGRLLTDSIKL